MKFFKAVSSIDKKSSFGKKSINLYIIVFIVRILSLITHLKSFELKGNEFDGKYLFIKARPFSIVVSIFSGHKSVEKYSSVSKSTNEFLFPCRNKFII